MSNSELLDRVHHATSYSQHHLQDVHHLCGAQCYMGPNHGKLKSFHVDFLANGTKYFFYPETKGLALEDVDRLFAKNEEVARRVSVAENVKANGLETRTEMLDDEKVAV